MLDEEIAVVWKETHELLKSNSWVMKLSKADMIIYESPLFESEIKVVNTGSDQILISVPVPNSNLQYITNFNSCSKIVSFINNHLKNYINITSYSF